MKFDLVINLERMDAGVDMRGVIDHVTQMVEMADAGGFAIAWAAEHHALEMTIAPGPFQLLAHWAAHTWRLLPTGTRSNWQAKLHCSTCCPVGDSNSESDAVPISGSSIG